MSSDTQALEFFSGTYTFEHSAAEAIQCSDHYNDVSMLSPKRAHPVKQLLIPRPIRAFAAQHIAEFMAEYPGTLSDILTAFAGLCIKRGTATRLLITTDPDVGQCHRHTRATVPACAQSSAHAVSLCHRRIGAPFWTTSPPSPSIPAG